QEARAIAERAARQVSDAQSALTSARTRCQVLQELCDRLAAQVEPAEADRPEAEAAAAEAERAVRDATDASAQLRRLRAELEGLESLRPAPAGDLKPLGEVI